MTSDEIFSKLDKLLDRLDRISSGAVEIPDWDKHFAFRWRKKFGGRPNFQPINLIDTISTGDLKGIEKQKNIVDQNTVQFVDGRPANNVLLTGARGTGKSSIVKAIFNKYSKKKLRLIEVGKDDLIDLPDMLDIFSSSEYKFLIFCDDLSFEASDPGYKAMKAVLDGSVLAIPKNVLIYATSNRRHLMPEYFLDNALTEYKKDEIHPTESIEESISLSERFGLWVSFYPFTQDLYLSIVEHWVNISVDHVEDRCGLKKAALQWAINRGSRSGRIAKQFAIDWVGKKQIRNCE